MNYLQDKLIKEHFERENKERQNNFNLRLKQIIQKQRNFKEDISNKKKYIQQPIKKSDDENKKKNISSTYDTEGKGLKKLTKSQRKAIILGEIKAGNNNPNLLNMIKK